MLEKKLSPRKLKNFIEENLHLLKTQEYVPAYRETLKNDTFKAILNFPDDNQRIKYLDRLVQI